MTNQRIPLDVLEIIAEDWLFGKPTAGNYNDRKRDFLRMVEALKKSYANMDDILKKVRDIQVMDRDKREEALTYVLETYEVDYDET
jgi:hypothetical protein